MLAGDIPEGGGASATIHNNECPWNLYNFYFLKNGYPVAIFKIPIF
jgi:hypothetical protein